MIETVRQDVKRILLAKAPCAKIWKNFSAMVERTPL
jgi:hypothetical protein